MPGDIYLFRGLGKGQFAKGEKLLGSNGKPARAGLASAVSAWDWNRDGRTDLIVGNIEGEVWFLPNETKEGKVHFGTKKPVRDQQGSEIIVSGDAGPMVAHWDSDSIPDLLVGSSDGSVVLYRGSGTEGEIKLLPAKTLVSERDDHGGVVQTVDPATGELVMPPLDRPGIRTKVAVHDWNGDGRSDLLVGDYCSATGPEPKLTPEQKKERDELQAQQDKISNAISDRYAAASRQAQEDLKEIRLADGEDRDEWVSSRSDQLLDKDTEYRDLSRKAGDLWKRLEPFLQKRSSHGFVWVYLRTSAPGAQREQLGVIDPQSEADPSEATLLARVVAKETGEPLRSVEVRLQPKELPDAFSWRNSRKSKGTIRESLRPNEQGVVEFAIPANEEFLLIASDESDNTTRAQQQVSAIPAGERQTIAVEITTQDDLLFCGRVVRSEDDSPVEGARIRAIRARSSYVSRGNEPGHEQWSMDELGEAASDSAGRFSLRVASWKRPHLRVDAPGFAFRVLNATQGHESPETAHVVKLVREASVNARIVDASGNPLTGAWVLLKAEGYSLSGNGEAESDFAWDDYISLPDEEWKEEVGPQGHCTISGVLPKVNLSVEVRKGGEVLRKDPGPFTLQPGEVREIEWRIGGGCTVTGVVLDQTGTPVADQEMWLDRNQFGVERYFDPYQKDKIIARTTTDARGAFEFRDVIPGKWMIGPAAQRDHWDPPLETALAPFAGSLEVGQEPAQQVTLHVYRGLYVRGVVLDPKGNPAPDCFVHAGREDATYLSLSTQTQKDGSFALGPVTTGRFRLSADSVEKYAPSEVVDAEAGQGGVTLRLKPGGGFSGRVVDARTGQGCRASLLWTPENPRQDLFGGGTTMSGTEEDGSFAKDGLEPGIYGLAARTDDGRFGILPGVSVTAESEVTNLLISVSPGGKVRLQYEGSKPQVFVMVITKGVPVGWATSVEAGKPFLVSAPAGSVTLGVSDAFKEKPREQQIEIVVGETKDFVLRD